MTKTVFLSGSRRVSRLNDMIRSRVDNMVRDDLRIVIGDANGADKALQNYLARENYHNVVVFCAGSTCRNNEGAWEVKKINVDPRVTGREFYTQKDKAMAREADCGLVLWDGKSAGAINNVLELLKGRKPVVVYLAPEKQFYTLKKPEDVRPLLDHCTEDDYRSISRKIQMDRRLEDLGVARQGALSL